MKWAYWSMWIVFLREWSSMCGAHCSWYTFGYGVFYSRFSYISGSISLLNLYKQAHCILVHLFYRNDIDVSIQGLNSPNDNNPNNFFCSDIRCFNTLRPRQNGRRFADDTFKGIFLNENVRISIKISLRFVPKGPINNIPSLVQIMAWRRSGDKPLSEPVMVSLLTHICVTRPQWVKWVS